MKRNFEEDIINLNRVVTMLRHSIEHEIAKNWKLEKFLLELSGHDFGTEPKLLRSDEAVKEYEKQKQSLNKLLVDFKKIKELTKCDEYEYITTTELKRKEK